MTYQIVLTTCPDLDTARLIAGALVEQRLAACVNILPGALSIYRWQGAVEEAQELLLVIKSRAELFPALEAAVRERHPYELPELIAAPIEAGLAPYLAWIHEQTDQQS